MSGTGEREIGRGDSEGMKNLTCFLGLVCSTGVEMGLDCLSIAGGMDELMGNLCEAAEVSQDKIYIRKWIGWTAQVTIKPVQKCRHSHFAPDPW